MASNERNALSELANELAKDAKIIFGSGGGGPLSSAISARQETASRIIAELAKLKVSSQLIGMLPTFHTIAEEGGSK